MMEFTIYQSIGLALVIGVAIGVPIALRRIKKLKTKYLQQAEEEELRMNEVNKIREQELGEKEMDDKIIQGKVEELEKAASMEVKEIKTIKKEKRKNGRKRKKKEI